MSGFAHGGPSAIVGATVNFYATTSGGYGAAPGAPLGVATTDANGYFAFNPSVVCPAGQQAYVTLYGGNPGSGTNNNYLLMAALGDCSTISSSTVIWIDEVTTVAAAYALRPFTQITYSGGVPMVQIGAPANNNASTGSCTTVSNVTTGCTAAGLKHAFANALNLANSVSIGSTNPTGTAYTVTPSNSNGSVPAALLNSLANAVETCVNSTGGVAGDSSLCGQLFSYTTPPVTSPVAPTDTLQAMLNVAQYPALTAGNVTGLFNLATPVSYYTPSLSTAPTDYSLAIAYSGVTPPSQVNSVSSLALTNINASSFGSGVGYTSVPAVTIAAPGGSGTTATATASLGLVYFNVTGGTCTNGTQTVTIGGGGGTGATATATISGGTATGGTVTASGAGYTSIPTFTVQNCTVQPSAAQKVKGLGVVGLAITNGGSGYASAPTVTIAAPGGTAPPTLVTATATASLGTVAFNAPYAIALDANDDVFIGSQNILGTAGAYSYLSGMRSDGSSLFSSTQSTTYLAPRGAAVDTLGNVWVAENNTTAILPYSTATGVAGTAVSTGAAPFGVGVDLANNVWYGIATTTAQNLFELKQSTSYGNVVFSTPPQFSSAIRMLAFDPNQNIYVSGFNATTNTAGSLPNTGTAAAPIYGTAPVLNTSLTGASGAGIALDSANNAWSPTTAGLVEIVPTFTGTTTTAITPAGPVTDGSTLPNYNVVDGAGSVWIADNQNQSAIQYVPSKTTAASYSPCYAPSGAQTCTPALSQPQRIQVDSTGAIWITSLSNKRIYQLIGPGSPVWPQLSLSTPGVMPQ